MDVEEFKVQVRETLEDVLPSRKMAKVTDSRILSVLEKYSERENTEIDMDYDYKYFPLKIVDLTINEIVSSMASKNAELDSSSDPEEVEDLATAQAMKDILVPLSRVYPDIDPMYLRTIIDKFSGNTNSIQDYLEANINTIPKRRNIQAVQYRVMSASCDGRKRERPWQCPQCRTWTIISLPKNLDTTKHNPHNGNQPV